MLTQPQSPVITSTPQTSNSKLSSSQASSPPTNASSSSVSRQPQLSLPNSSVVMFLVASIERIASDKETKRAKNADLRQACSNALDLLKSFNDARKDQPHLPPLQCDSPVQLGCEQLLQPLLLACSAKSPKLVCMGIDSLQKLIAYGHVSNDVMLTSSQSSDKGHHAQTPGVRLIEAIVTKICSCFQGVQTDDGIQLQVLKALLTVMTSAVVEVHEADLLLIVRTCYNIYMASRNSINQGTARATLTQIVNLLFSRMEQVSLDAALQSGVSPGVNGAALPQVIDQDSTDEHHPVNEKSLPDETQPKPLSTDVNLIVDSIMDSIIDRALSASSPPPAICNGTSAVVPSSDSMPSPPPSQTSPPSTVDDDDEQPAQTVDDQHLEQVMASANRAQKDAFLVFRSLCRMLSKDFTGSNVNVTTVRSHTFSLQLLLSIFQNSSPHPSSIGPLFLNSDLFIAAVKHYLCLAILKNGVSHVAEISKLSIDLFLLVLDNFKPYLKRHIEAFFRDVFLVILESPSSSTKTGYGYEHKRWCILAINRMLEANPQAMVELYLNYDCDLACCNVFERLVGAVAKLGQGGQQDQVGASDQLTIVQRQTLRSVAIDCLVRILATMSVWASKELCASPEVHSLLGNNDSVDEETSSKGRGDRTSTGGLTSEDNIYPNGQANSSSVKPPDALDDDPDHFETRKARKGCYESALALFNYGHGSEAPDRAFAMLVDANLMPDASVQSVTELFATEPRLSKTRIGEFLGQHNAFNLEVMNAFIDRFDFAGKGFVAAIREFLGSFRLPGEAQKVDRLMQKFAARYYSCNPDNDVFASADSAYVLAFSVIILTTDLHSKQIKPHHRMSKRDYINMNRGINETGDLPEAYIGQIYDEIAQCEIELKSTEGDMITRLSGHISNNQQASTANDLKVASNGAAGRDELASVCSNESDYTNATHCQHIRPMFKLAWTPFLAAFSVSLQDCDSLGLSRSCLTGISCAIRIACIFGLDVERNAYVQALSRFTLLLMTSAAPSAYNASLSDPNSSSSSPTEAMKQKNIDTIRTLIAIAQTDANYLGRSWVEILRCISQLESTHSLSAAGASNAMKSAGNLRRGSVASADHVFTAPGSLAAASVDVRKAAVLQEVMGETGTHSVLVAVDKVFTGSIRLNGCAIVDFVQALCQVSREELNLPQPRTYALQKLVEISYYNLGRIRLQWSRIWEHIGSHFTQAAQSADRDVAEFVVDSLRQLAVKLIEKGELPNFHFQKEFLRPFVYILDSKGSKISEDLVVRCLSQLVFSHHAQIRSGWVNIFAGLHVVAQTPDDPGLIQMAFNTAAFVVDRLLPDELPSLVHAFQPLVKLLADFACNLAFPDLGMESITLIRKCAQRVADSPDTFISAKLMLLLPSLPSSSTDQQRPAPTASQVAEDETDLRWLRGWLPVLCELFRVVNSCKLEVRTRALTVFFDILKSHGHSFKPMWWKETFSILLRLFQPLRMAVNDSTQLKSDTSPPSATSMERAEWLTTTCNHALFSIVDIFTQNFDLLHELLLADILEQLRWCCICQHEQLARSGISCLETLILSCGPKFSDETWRSIVQILLDLFKQSLPEQLLTWRPITSAGPDSSSSRASLFSSLLIKCVVQFELIQATDHILFNTGYSKRQDAVNLAEARQLVLLSAATASSNSCSSPSLSSTAGKDSAVGESTDSHPSTNGIKTETWWIGPTMIRVPVRSHTTGSTVGDQQRQSDQDDSDSGNQHPSSALPGVYPCMSPAYRLEMVNCLLESHSFAKAFNSNDEQRNLLFEAGFKIKAKPNLLKQETHSLATALRILFRLADEESDVRQHAEDLLNCTIVDSIAYYKTLLVEGHRQAWDNSCLILLLTNLVYSTPTHRFLRHAPFVYAAVCDLIPSPPSVSPEVAALVRLVLLRCGALFVTSASG